jgi:DNA-binding NtrC family response regulator
VDVRIIGATHRNLTQLLKDGTFRSDLYARLNEYPLMLPPLRDRKEDLLMLLEEFFRRHGGKRLEPSFQFMTALLHYDWPYNVRELESCAKRCVVLSDGQRLGEDMLPAEIVNDMQLYGQLRLASSQQGDASASPTRDELVSLLERHKGNIAAVGRDLGKARMQVHRWLKRHDLDSNDFRV